LKLKTRADCPVCCQTMEFNWETQDIPHFGEVMLISGVCSCGFRHCDTMLLSQKEPLRHRLRIDNEDDLSARVIRSSSGTIRIPQLGIDVEPGFASDCYISNVEGVLRRIKDIVSFASKSALREGEISKAERGDEIIRELEEAIDGRGGLTILLEDPLGNSAILSDDVEVSALTDEEVASLQTGMIILDEPSEG